MAVVEQLERDRPVGEFVAGHLIARNDGTLIFSNLSHSVREVEPESEHRALVDRLWWMGALLTVGDAIAAADLDHGPDLELIRHLRNGVAHGNRFKLMKGEPRRQAFFFGPPGRFLPDRTIVEGDVPHFRIDSAVHRAPVLFEFMGPGDLDDLFQFVSLRLIRFGTETMTCRSIRNTDRGCAMAVQVVAAQRGNASARVPAVRALWSVRPTSVPPMLSTTCSAAARPYSASDFRSFSEESIHVRTGL